MWTMWPICWKAESRSALRRSDLHYLRGPDGRVAEWLGTALQKLLLRFESARDLEEGTADRPVPSHFRSIGATKYLGRIPIGPVVRWCGSVIP